MRNSFNLLLVSLAIVDSSYLLGSMLESIRSYFGVTRLHLILFPYFLYPMNKFFMTASIFLTVAIAIERYVAVHYPIDYNIVSRLKKRVLLTLVVQISVVQHVYNYMTSAAQKMCFFCTFHLFWTLFGFVSPSRDTYILCHDTHTRISQRMEMKEKQHLFNLL